MSDIEARLKDLGIVLPTPALAVANYVPYVQEGGLLFVSGQLPLKEGKLAYEGHLGAGISLEHGIEAARLCGINLLAQAQAAVGGDWGKIKRLVRLGGFVACTPQFTDHPKVINGASDLMVAVLGEKGRHARFAVGVSSLPLGAAVEIEGIFAI